MAGKEKYFGQKLFCWCAIEVVGDSWWTWYCSPTSCFCFLLFIYLFCVFFVCVCFIFYFLLRGIFVTHEQGHLNWSMEFPGSCLTERKNERKMKKRSGKKLLVFVLEF